MNEWTFYLIFELGPTVLITITPPQGESVHPYPTNHDMCYLSIVPIHIIS
jgi:hypothetical protein